MSAAPLWLPAMIVVEGVWEEALARLYACFEDDFKRGRPRLEHRRVLWDTRILPGDRYEEGFWHLITRDDRAAGRIPDFRRAERLPWCAPAIWNCRDVAVKMWDYCERGRLRCYVWIERVDYVVVLEKRVRCFGAVAYLVTAFHVDGDSSRRSLERKYQQREV